MNPVSPWRTALQFRSLGIGVTSVKALVSIAKLGWEFGKPAKIGADCCDSLCYRFCLSRHLRGC